MSANSVRILELISAEEVNQLVGRFLLNYFTNNTKIIIRQKKTLVFDY